MANNISGSSWGGYCSLGESETRNYREYRDYGGSN